MRARDATLPVLVLSMHDESIYAERALRAGANGYIMKQEATEHVLVAIRRILEGDVYVSDRVASRMLEQYVRGAGRGRAAGRCRAVRSRARGVPPHRRGAQHAPDRRDAAPEHQDRRNVPGAHQGEARRSRNARELVQHAIEWTLSRPAIAEAPAVNRPRSSGNFPMPPKRTSPTTNTRRSPLVCNRHLVVYSRVRRSPDFRQWRSAGFRVEKESPMADADPVPYGRVDAESAGGSEVHVPLDHGRPRLRRRLRLDHRRHAAEHRGRAAGRRSPACRRSTCTIRCSPTRSATTS